MTALAPAPPHRPSRLRRGLSDAAVYSVRSLRHEMRNIDALLVGVLLPVFLLLLFVYVFGGALEASTSGSYVDYALPGIMLLCAGYGAANTGMAVNRDLTTGIVDRFRTLPTAAWLVMLGHVLSSMARNLFSSLIVLGTALLVGFSPNATPGEWLAAVGMLSLYIFALTWTAVVVGLLANSPETASAFGFFLLFLPYLSSAFVPTETMPDVLHGFAEHQMLTPIIESLRGLLLGTPIGSSGTLALIWCLGLTAIAAPLSAWLFRRRTSS